MGVSYICAAAAKSDIKERGMADPRISFQSRTISFDFDGVLASLVLGKRWAKTRKKKSPIPLVSAAVRALEGGGRVPHGEDSRSPIRTPRRRWSGSGRPG